MEAVKTERRTIGGAILSTTYTLDGRRVSAAAYAEAFLKANWEGRYSASWTETKPGKNGSLVIRSGFAA